MDRYLLIVSTACFLAAVLHTLRELRTGVFRPMRFNFLAVALGFVFQTAFLWFRGHALGRCPITNLFEVFIFLAWSVAAIYMVVGPAYRLSLMGAFTAPLVVLLQGFALLAPIDTGRPVRLTASPWLEFHASISLVAYGVFALACIASIMYLVQEHQLKTRQLHSIFYHLPPLTDLFAAITRLLWWGFALYTLGILRVFYSTTAGSIFSYPAPLSLLYALFFLSQHNQHTIFTVTTTLPIFGMLYFLGCEMIAGGISKRVATLCILGFSAALTLLWGITFMAELHPLP